MAATYQYIISLQDRVSATMQRIVGAAAASTSRITALSTKARQLQTDSRNLAGGIDSLRDRIGALQKERNLLNPSNLKEIQVYNREIGRLEEQMEKLENTGKGGGLKRHFSELGGMLKQFINPATLIMGGGAMIGANAMSFDEGMAKINITAQLEEAEFNGLKKRLRDMAADNKMDISLIPVGFEKIISQTGDVEMSLEILDAALKGAKGGFTDLDTVTGALAQTMSIVGKGNANAMEVLDTFFASKRVGAGEFADFATYMPGLIAAADALGLKYKEVAGMYAYMTGKGQDAARSSVLLNNVFSLLGKADVSKSLGLAGAPIFDEAGKMRSVVDIFRDLSGVMSGMTDQQKSNFLEKAGITDKEAKNAVAILTSDVDKLRGAMTETAASAGETDKALQFSKNSIQKSTELWNEFKLMIHDLGQVALPLINAGLWVLSGIVSILSGVVGGVLSFCSAWFTALQDGNPWVWALTVAVGYLAVALSAYELWTNRAVIATKARAFWDGIVTGVTKVWTAVQWSLNAALWACPLTWIVAAVMALIGAIVLCATKVSGWGKQWDVIVNFAKNVWELFIEKFQFSWNLMTNGFMMGIDKIKLGWYKFKESVGLGDSAENQAMIEKINGDIEGRKQAIVDGAKRIAELTEKTKNSLTWELSWKKGEETPSAADGGTAPDQPGVTPPLPPALDFNALMGKMSNKTKKGSSVDKSIDLNFTPDYKGTGAYNAIAARLAMVQTKTEVPVKAEGVPGIQPPAPTVAPQVAAAMPGIDKADYKENNGDTLKDIAGNVAKIVQLGIPLMDGIKGIVASVQAGFRPGMPVPIVQEAEIVSSAADKKASGDVLQGIAGGVTKIVQLGNPLMDGIKGIAASIAAIALLNSAHVPVMAPIPIAEVPTVKEAAAPPMMARPEVNTEENHYTTANSRTVQMAKYCDQVVINVQNTDSRGTDEIERRIRETLKNVFDNYEA